MKTVTADAFHENLHIQEEEIVLNGPPGKLTGHVLIRNNEDETLFIKELALYGGPKRKGSDSAHQETIRFITSLLPKEERTYKIRHSLPENTPPGTYAQMLEVGGGNKKIKFIVQENIKIDLYPLNLYFIGVAAKKSYTAQLSLINKGNIPFTIPDIKHVTTLDEDYLCRATTMAMREKGGEGFIAMMDALTKNIHKDMAGWAIVSIKESGSVLEPGEYILMQFTLILPENIDPKKDYSGNIRFWDKTISYSIKSQDVPSSEKLKNGK